MKRNKQQVPGFTLVELSVVMIISSILVILLYSGLNQVQRALIHYRTQQAEWTEWDGFRSQLTYDWHQAYQVDRVGPNAIKLWSANRSITYGWHPEGWWRQQGGRIDSVGAGCPNPVLVVNQNSVGQLSLTCRVQEAALPLLLTKAYGQADQINQTLH